MPDERRHAKAIIFAALYGVPAMALAPFLSYRPPSVSAFQAERRSFSDNLAWLAEEQKKTSWERGRLLSVLVAFAAKVPRTCWERVRDECVQV